MGLRFILECLENSLKYGLIFFGLCSSNLHTMQVHTHTYTLFKYAYHIRDDSCIHFNFYKKRVYLQIINTKFTNIFLKK